MQKKTIYALGFFDGVHLGHQALLAACRDLAVKNNCNAGVITFTNHPDSLVSGDMPRLINTMEDRRLLLRRLRRYGTDGLLTLLDLQEADMGSKGTGVTDGLNQFPRIRQMVADLLAENACLQIKDLAVGGSDLIALGFTPGPALGKCLESLLNQVQDGKTPNEREPLLQSAQIILTEVTL